MLTAWLCYLPSSCELHALQPAYLQSPAEQDRVPGLCPKESAICCYLGNWFFQGRTDPDCSGAAIANPRTPAAAPGTGAAQELPPNPALSLGVG